MHLMVPFNCEEAVEKSISFSRFHLFLSLIDCSSSFLEDCVVTDFLSHQVVRSFEDDDIYHVGGKVNPTSDLDFINLKLIFCDLDQVTLTYSFPFSNLAKHSFIKAALLHLLTRNTDL